jgi:hypothetical protein
VQSFGSSTAAASAVSKMKLHSQGKGLHLARSTLLHRTSMQRRLARLRTHLLASNGRAHRTVSVSDPTSCLRAALSLLRMRWQSAADRPWHARLLRHRRRALRRAQRGQAATPWPLNRRLSCTSHRLSAERLPRCLSLSRLRRWEELRSRACLLRRPTRRSSAEHRCPTLSAGSAQLSRALTRIILHCSNPLHKHDRIFTSASAS